MESGGYSLAVWRGVLIAMASLVAEHTLLGHLGFRRVAVNVHKCPWDKSCGKEVGLHTWS